ncbi:Tim10/DDP family zinc finger-domain-containing protein [Hypoxylon sp. NC1633]|nr:Tim10/DDP family zinc finger-domain-containing protein [Hypoxylon sp. NC1633]
MSDFNANELDVEKLSEKDRAELRAFLTKTSQKSRFQNHVHTLTDMCFKKCVTSTIRSGNLEKNEETCLANCADRFFDISKLCFEHLQTLRSGH